MLIQTTTVSLTPQEQVGYLLHMTRGRAKVTIYMLVGLAVLSFIGWLTIRENILAILAVFYLAMIPFELFRRRFWYRRYVQNPQNALMRVPARATITDVDIVLDSESGIQTKLPWTSVLRAEHWSGNIILYLAEYHSVVMLPRAFTPADWQQFQEFVSQHVRCSS